ncbi:type IV pilin protein [Burkholderia sp. Ac-20379]|uniref:type IV pilin protein n=1 Tax=Burkholderia sp. Ac-20379 TaxID=2703900 RepID=UPI0030D786F6
MIRPCTRWPRSNDTRAFTLIEMTIVLAVVAVIAAFAVPSYRRQIEHGHRLAAVTALYRAAHDLASRGRGEPGRQPVELGTIPEQGAPVYRLTVEAVESGGYVLSATPTRQGPMAADRCGSYLLRSDGSRANRMPGDETGPGEPRPACWTMR